jgi:hypothetical protein
MEDTSHMRSFGVFKPVGHVVISFPTAGAMRAAARDLRDAGFGGEEGTLREIDDRAMVAQADADLKRASPLAAIGQELNLVKAQRELALLGYHFLVVKADDDAARRVADIASRHQAERAQHYGQFVIEDLIQHPGDTGQVAESPDRGLDAQTPSGVEAERAALRPGRERDDAS